MLARTWTAIGICTSVLLAVLLLLSINTVFFTDIVIPHNLIRGDIVSDLISIVLCNVIFLAVFLDRRDDSANRVFLFLLSIETVLLFSDIQCWVWDGDPDRIMLVTVMNYTSYLCVLAMVTFYWVLLRALYKPFGREMARFGRIIAVLAAAGALLILTNPLTGLYFTIGPDGVYHRSDTFLLSLIAPNLIGIVEVYCILKFESKPRRKLVFLSYILLSWSAMVVQFFNYGISLQYISFMFSFVLMYANIYLDRGTELIANEAKMNEQTAAIMVSQIQPHFLYNALTSIMNIKGNPPRTRDAIAEFGSYLRSNLDSLATTNPVPVQREIEHVETYIYLRQLKFGDRLKVNYDIQDTAFFLPPQTIKTIIGAMIEYNLEKENVPLTITLSTKDTERGHVVILHNDSITSMARSYVRDRNNPAIAAMVSRLDFMVGGSLRNVDDSRGGSSVEILIPHHRRPSQ